MTSSIGLAGFVVTTCMLFSLTSAVCTFPLELQGTWLTGKRDTIIITDEFVFQFELDAVGEKTFRCQEQYGDRYVVKTTNTFSYIDPTLIFSALICFDFRYVSTDLYYYYMASDNSGTERVYFNLDDLAVNASTVCSVDPADYVIQSYDVMLRDGNIDSTKRACPNKLQKYWAYNIDKGSGNLCNNERSMDVCSSANEITFNYTQCDEEVAYSATGVLNCLVSVSSGSTIYVTLYNNDSSVDDSTTFRLSCWAFSSSGVNLQVTQHPRLCSETQNSTYVDASVGVHLLLFNGTACSTTTPTDLTWLFITLGVVFGVILIVVSIYFFSKYKAKQKPFRGGLEPANMGPEVPRLMNGHSFKPSPGIPENDAPVNVMHLLRKDLATPAGRDSPSSNFNVAITTPPQLFNIREIDSYGPSPTQESPNQRKDYHVLGGADQSEYGDLPLEEEKTSHTPVMVLPVKKTGFAVEELEDDYDDDDDDDLLTTPGRSRLVAATQGMYGADPMCPATRLPGITEDVAMDHSQMSLVGARKPLAGSGMSSIIFLNEQGVPLPPRTPTPPDAVETVRDSNSKLRVKSKRKASLTKKALKKAESIRGESETPRDGRGPPEPDRGEESDNAQIIFSVFKPNRKLETGIGPASARSSAMKKGGKPPGALLRSRAAILLDNRRGEPEKDEYKTDVKAKEEREITNEDGDKPSKDKNVACAEIPKVQISHSQSDAKTLRSQTSQGHSDVKTPRSQTSQGHSDVKTPRAHTSQGQSDIKTPRAHTSQGQSDVKSPRKDNSVKKETPRQRAKTASGTRETGAKVSIAETRQVSRTPSTVEAEDQHRPRSCLPMTRVDIPDLSPPVPGNNSTSKPTSNEIIDSPRRSSVKSQGSSNESKPRKMWLDPVRSTTNVWDQMSSVWRDGQIWSRNK